MLTFSFANWGSKRSAGGNSNSLLKKIIEEPENNLLAFFD